MENIIRMITGNINYVEMHNALFDAIDELKIMQYLRYSLRSYYQNVDPVENIQCVHRSNNDNNKFEIGDRIYHSKFGHGLIVESEKSKDYFAKFQRYIITVVFIEYGTKNIMVPLEKIIVKEL